MLLGQAGERAAVDVERRRRLRPGARRSGRRGRPCSGRTGRRGSRRNARRAAFTWHVGDSTSATTCAIRVDLRLLPPREPAGEQLDQRRRVGGRLEHRVALARLRRPRPRSGPARRGSRSPPRSARGCCRAPSAASSGASVVQTRPARPAVMTSRRNRARSPSNRAVHLIERRHRLDPIAGIERRPLPEHAAELQVRERRAQHQRPDVVPRRTGRTRTPRTATPGGSASSSSTSARERLGASACRRRRSSRASGTSSAQASSSQVAGAPSRPARPISWRVALERLGQVVVVDVADVGLVDAHAEGDRRDDDAAPAGHEPLLHRRALVGAPSRRGRRAPAVPGVGQQIGDVARPCAGGDVDDRRARPGARGAARRSAASRVGRGRPAWCAAQVRPVEAGDDDVVVGDAEGGADVAHHLRRRGGRQRQHAPGAELARAARRASGSRAGSCGPTRRCSAPRRPRTARSACAGAARGTARWRAARARRTAA